MERNALLVEDLLRSDKGEAPHSADDNSLKMSIRAQTGGAVNKAEIESLKQQLEVAQQWVEAVREEKTELENEYGHFKQMAADKENDFKGLSDAYNALEQDNVRLEREVRTLQAALQEGGLAHVPPSHEELEKAREEGRQEAQKDSEGELNDLLVCLGQEETKVERLKGRLENMGENVEKLLEGIGEPEGGVEEDDDVDD